MIKRIAALSMLAMLAAPIYANEMPKDFGDECTTIGELNPLIWNKLDEMIKINGANLGFDYVLIFDMPGKKMVITFTDGCVSGIG